MNREVHVPFCERLRGRFPRSTHHQLHWVLDVALREDECGIYRENSAENLAGIRHIAVNLLKQEKSRKRGIAARQRVAAMSTDYLEKVIGL